MEGRTFPCDREVARTTGIKTGHRFKNSLRSMGMPDTQPWGQSGIKVVSRGQCRYVSAPPKRPVERCGAVVAPSRQPSLKVEILKTILRLGLRNEVLAVHNNLAFLASGDENFDALTQQWPLQTM